MRYNTIEFSAKIFKKGFLKMTFCYTFQNCTEIFKNIHNVFQDLDKVKLPYILQSIHSLIGYFNLDPNRVLDIILESFEKQPHQVPSYTIF